jgi:hypothetical protein
MDWNGQVKFVPAGLVLLYLAHYFSLDRDRHTKEFSHLRIGLDLLQRLLGRSLPFGIPMHVVSRSQTRTNEQRCQQQAELHRFPMRDWFRFRMTAQRANFPMLDGILQRCSRISVTAWFTSLSVGASTLPQPRQFDMTASTSI